MPVPIIDTQTSLLALTENQPYWIQFSATETPTSWAIVDGELPSGLVLDTATGVVSGTPDMDAAGSIYKIHLVATNGTGSSTEMVVVMGVERNSFEISAAIELEISLRTGVVTMPLVNQLDKATGRLIVHAKSGDLFPLSLAFTKNGYSHDLSMTAITVTAKEYDGDSAVTLSNGSWRKIGGGLGTRYQAMIDLTSSSLSTILSNYEADKGTTVDMLCEVSAEYYQDIGLASPVEATRTSQTFILRLDRELG